jgi:hypothetical protein
MVIAALSLDVRSGGLAFVSGVLGALLVLMLGVALLAARQTWIGPIVGLFVLLYVGHLLVAPGSDLLTAGVVGVALLLVGELSQWSFDSRLRGQYDGALHRARALGFAGLALLGAGVVLLTLVVIGLPVPAGLGTIAAGMGAFVALVVLISVVALRPARPTER